MEIILSSNCKSLTGALGKHFGYHIQHCKNGFFAKRNAKGEVPPDGHLRFIIACAELAKSGLHIEDIRVKGEELNDALNEAGVKPFIFARKKNMYNAGGILLIKSINRL